MCSSSTRSLLFALGAIGIVCAAWCVIAKRHDSPPAIAARNVRTLVAVGIPLRDVTKADNLELRDSDPAIVLRGLSVGLLASPVGDERFERWVDMDPREATAWACSFAAEPWGRRFLGQAGEVWARRDLAAALEWLDGQPDSEGKNQLRAVIGYIAVDTFPRTALRLALELPFGASQDSLGALAVSVWAAREPFAATAFIGRLPPCEYSDRLLVALTSSWARNDGFEALQFALTQLPPGEAQTQAVEAIVRRGGTEAVGWAARLPSEALRDIGLPAWVVLWAERDPKAVATWLREMQPSALRDESIAAYARFIASRLPGEAGAWVARIADAQLREATFVRVQEARR